jgi:cytochrome P450
MTAAAPSSFVPTELEKEQDPYPSLARLRDEARVRRLESGFWAVTGYDAAMEALRHPGCRSNPIAMRYLEGLPPGAARDEMSNRINFLDPPDHPRVRAIVSKAFTPRRIALLRPWIEQTAEQLLDGLGGLDRIDLLRKFAHQLPSLVISEMLGVPAADRDQLTAWSDAVAPLLGINVSQENKDRAVAAAEEFHAYLGALLDERRRALGDDLLSALLTAEENGERLRRVELLSLAATLYSAGHRTTRDLFTNGMSVLLSSRERWQNVVEGRWSVEHTVEEFLRYETPTLFVVRVPLEPVTIAGVDVGPFEPLLVFLSAANRDPAIFDAPETFRPGRGAVPALSFAYGAHFCLGASLARSEAETMLGAVVRRWPKLRLDAERELHWHQRGPFRGLDELVVMPA